MNMKKGFLPVFLCAAMASYAGSAHKTMRSAIVEAEGFSFYEENKTMADLREQALADAKREAMQKAQSYLKTITRVENFQLSYDLIEIEAEGYVRILQIQDLGIGEDKRYHCRIQAEIAYEIPVIQNPDSARVLESAQAPLTVKVWTEKSEYKTGEEVKIYIRGNKDFYARVVYMDVEKKMIMILPNLYRKTHFFKAEETITIPAPDDKFKLRVRPPLGEEKIWVYASTAPLGSIDTQELGNSLLEVKNDLKSLGTRTRSIEIFAPGQETAGVPTEVSSGKDNYIKKNGEEFFEATHSITTK
ncbi:DUF4384 domain-containing protein [bacterium]|nr:DUF4384 domain-containing protein [bacterium]